MVEETGQFAVSILDREQEDASNYFASRGREPGTDFGTVGINWTDSGLPVVQGSAAWVSCKLHSAFVQGSHTICVGEVTEAWSDAERKPLLYFRRAYRGVEGL